jgi:hypothetical protein
MDTRSKRVLLVAAVVIAVLMSTGSLDGCYQVGNNWLCTPAT